MADRLVEILRGIAEDPAPWFWNTAGAHGAKVAAEVRALVRAEVAGDQLDAERRGDVYDPCMGCVHEAHELTCLAVIDPPRAQRCGCRTRKSELLTGG